MKYYIIIDEGKAIDYVDEEKFNIILQQLEKEYREEFSFISAGVCVDPEDINRWIKEDKRLLIIGSNDAMMECNQLFSYGE